MKAKVCPFCSVCVSRIKLETLKKPRHFGTSFTHFLLSQHCLLVCVCFQCSAFFHHLASPCLSPGESLLLSFSKLWRTFPFGLKKAKVGVVQWRYDGCLMSEWVDFRTFLLSLQLLISKNFHFLLFSVSV